MSNPYVCVCLRGTKCKSQKKKKRAEWQPVASNGGRLKRRKQERKSGALPPLFFFTLVLAQGHGRRRPDTTPKKLPDRALGEGEERRFAAAVSGLVTERHGGRQPKGELALIHLWSRSGKSHTFRLCQSAGPARPTESR